MDIQIIPRQCGGTEFLAQPHRLHLGAQNAAGVDTLHFALPAAWQGCTVALYLRRTDGTPLAPVALGTDGSVTVDRRLTGCTGGQWMLAAVNDSYTAYTRPGSYDTYATLPTDGGVEDPAPSLYEQFVAQVLAHAAAASDAAQRAQSAADRAEAAITPSAADALIAALPADETAPADEDCFVVQSSGDTPAACRRPMSALWSSIKAKADEAFAKKTHLHTPATQTVPGFLSAYDKKKLDSISWNATSGITAATSTYCTRYSNGVQLCWGAVDDTAEPDAAVTLPAPFANTSYAVALTNASAGSARYLLPANKTTTAFTPSGSGAFSYLAVGRWK